MRLQPIARKLSLFASPTQDRKLFLLLTQLLQEFPFSLNLAMGTEHEKKKFIFQDLVFLKNLIRLYI